MIGKVYKGWFLNYFVKMVKEKEQKNKWKTIAIIFIILFILETSYIVYAVSVYNHKLKQTNDCYYNFCADYPDADYTDGVCTCYDYDVLGNEQPVNTRYMK